MIEEEILEEAPPEPDSPPDEPAPLGTGVTGDGPPDGFGLSSRGDGGGYGRGTGGRIGGGSRFGGYGAKIQRTLQEALQNNPKLRNANFRSMAAVWLDSSGRITRVRLSESTGTSRENQEVQSTAVGLRLYESPPADMPMPVRIRLAFRKPN